MVKVTTGQRISDDTTVAQLRGISQKMGHLYFNMSNSCLVKIENDGAKAPVVVQKVEKTEDDEPKDVKKSGKKK